MATKINIEKGKEIALEATDAYSKMTDKAQHNSTGRSEHREIMGAAVTEAKRILDEQLSEQFKK